VESYKAYSAEGGSAFGGKVRKNVYLISAIAELRYTFFNQIYSASWRIE